MDIDLKCSCGKIFSQSKRFTVYDRDFCGMECLMIYKKEKDSQIKKAEEARLSKLPNSNGRPFDYCKGGAC